MKDWYKYVATFKVLAFLFANALWVIGGLVVLVALISVLGITSHQVYNVDGGGLNQESIVIGELIEQSPYSAPYVVTNEFGLYTGELAYLGNHWGIDMSGGYGAKIHTVLDGEVLHVTRGCRVGQFFGVCAGYGNYVTVKHVLLDEQTQTQFELFTRYAHLDMVLVSVGDILQQGQQIGTQGNTGRSTGTHLHFEVRTADGYNHPQDAHDPRNYFEL